VQYRNPSVFVDHLNLLITIARAQHYLENNRSLRLVSSDADYLIFASENILSVHGIVVSQRQSSAIRSMWFPQFRYCII